MAAEKLITLSDLYCQDLAEGSILVPEYPVSSVSTYRDGEPVKPFYQNDGGKYPMYDAFEIPKYQAFKFMKPQTHMAVCGDKLRVCTDYEVPTLLEGHWSNTLGRKTSVRYATPSADTKCITMFPYEHLTPEQHNVHPDNHYHVYSKYFINEIPCAQARTLNLNQPQFPCVIKCAYGAGSKSTFMCYNEEDYREILEEFRSTEPGAPIVMTEMVPDVVDNYCCQFYLTKKGEMQWLGVSEQLLGMDGLWMGGKMRQSEQPALEDLLKPTLVPVAAKLHEWQYSGVVGVDILIDSEGKHYVIDINPRLNGSTPMVLVSKVMGAQGWDAGIFLSGIKFQGTLAELITAIENVNGGKMMLFGVYEAEGYLNCNIGVWGKTTPEAEEVFKQVFVV